MISIISSSLTASTMGLIQYRRVCNHNPDQVHVLSPAQRIRACKLVEKHHCVSRIRPETPLQIVFVFCCRIQSLQFHRYLWEPQYTPPVHCPVKSVPLKSPRVLDQMERNRFKSSSENPPCTFRITPIRRQKAARVAVSVTSQITNFFHFVALGRNIPRFMEPEKLGLEVLNLGFHSTLETSRVSFVATAARSNQGSPSCKNASTAFSSSSP